MTLRRGFRLEPGEAVVVVEDVITTGGSTREVMECVRALGARVLAVGSLVDRSGGSVDLGVPRALAPRPRGPDLGRPRLARSAPRAVEAREARVARRRAVTRSPPHPRLRRHRLRGLAIQAARGRSHGPGRARGRPRPASPAANACAVAAAGRTDAGVHALGQVVSFELAAGLGRPKPAPRPERAAARGRARPRRGRESRDFHARRSAVSKLYRYVLDTGRVQLPTRRRSPATCPGALDRSAVRAAAALYLGRHDFASLASAGGDVKTTVRTVSGPSFVERTVSGGADPGLRGRGRRLPAQDGAQPGGRADRGGPRGG